MNPAEFLQNARDFLPILLQGAWVTIQITVLSFLHFRIKRSRIALI